LFFSCCTFCCFAAVASFPFFSGSSPSFTFPPLFTSSPQLRGFGVISWPLLRGSLSSSSAGG
jgi:hypothetical protein